MWLCRPCEQRRSVTRRATRAPLLFFATHNILPGLVTYETWAAAKFAPAQLRHGFRSRRYASIDGAYTQIERPVLIDFRLPLRTSHRAVAACIRSRPAVSLMGTNRCG